MSCGWCSLCSLTAIAACPFLPAPRAWRQVGDKGALERQYEQEQHTLQQLRSKADMLRGSLGTIRDRVSGRPQLAGFLFFSITHGRSCPTLGCCCCVVTAAMAAMAPLLTDASALVTTTLFGFPGNAGGGLPAGAGSGAVPWGG